MDLVFIPNTVIYGDTGKVNSTMELLAALKNMQEDMGCTNPEFAKLLSISPKLWQSIRHGQRQIAMKLLVGVVRNFPELMPEVVAYLRNGAGKPLD